MFAFERFAYSHLRHSRSLVFLHKTLRKKLLTIEWRKDSRKAIISWMQCKKCVNIDRRRDIIHTFLYPKEKHWQSSSIGKITEHRSGKTNMRRFLYRCFFATQRICSCKANGTRTAPSVNVRVRIASNNFLKR